MRKFFYFIILISCFFCTTGCNIVHQNLNNVSVNKTLNSEIKNRSYLDPIFTVIDGKVTCIRTDYLLFKSDEETLKSIENAFCNRSFVGFLCF